MQLVEAVEAIVDLIAGAREGQEQPRERGDREKLTRARMDMEDINPRWIGTATKTKTKTMTMDIKSRLGNRSLPPTHP